MKLNELQTKLNEFVKAEKLNTLEKQTEQTFLVGTIQRKVYKLLQDDKCNLTIISKRNHIVITQNYRYPIENALVDIVIKFKKGTEHSRYSYTQYYYINTIEVQSRYENINTIEDVILKIREKDAKEQQIKRAQIEEVKQFLHTHNITLDEMNKYTNLYKQYKYIIEEEFTGREN